MTLPPSPDPFRTFEDEFVAPPADVWRLRREAFPDAAFEHPSDSRFGTTYASEDVRRTTKEATARLEWIRYRNYGWAEVGGPTSGDSYRIWWFGVADNDRRLDALWRALVNFDLEHPGVVLYMVVVHHWDTYRPFGGRYIHVETVPASRLDVRVPREDPVVYDWVLDGAHRAPVQYVLIRGIGKVMDRKFHPNYILAGWRRSWVYYPRPVNGLRTNRR